MTPWLIMGTPERTEVTQNFENRQFEFFPKEKVSRTRFCHTRRISRYNFWTGVQKPLEMTPWLIMGTPERTEVTQNFENRQFEF
ncbi:hypothetical protein, partial [Allomuricauda sp. ARW1Y1]|uniref:hypothetical protein n=1 Tax=Allomuricauda sp. ARW1Y1 TaxID=2663843 RepID=UPI0015C71158